MKGRSSSPPLLRLLRALAAHLLFGNMMLYARWVEGWRNHADGPSRGQKVGQAEKMLPQRCRIDVEKAHLMEPHLQ